ncbi:hypothetical protein FMM68_06080 [Lachnospiraceae bacterium MD329]|nr:hypothetical protein [Lachnospiraceae bacterium MD329]
MKKAFSGVGFVVFVFVFAIVATLSIEYYRIFSFKESVETDISRALNISVDIAMQDINRIQHKSIMDTDTARIEFKKYLKDNMGLNSFNEKYDNNGKFMYRLIIEDEQVQRSPAKYISRGKIRMQPIIIRKFFPDDGYTFDLPFKQESRNTRYDD